MNFDRGNEGPPRSFQVGSLKENLNNFEKYSDRSGRPVDRHYCIQGTTFSLRYANEVMLPVISPALEHLQVEVAGPSELTIYIWDSESTGAPAIVTGCDSSSPAKGEIWIRNETSETSAFRPADNLLYQLNADEGVAHFWAQDGTDLPFDERVGPLRHILSWWLRERDLYFVHSSGVGTDSGGLLIAGNNGAGKSTTALTCLNSGLKFFGDNYVLVGGGPRPNLSTLYASASLRIPHAKNVPDILAPFNPSTSVQAGKQSAYLNHVYPDRMASGLPLRAIAFPLLTDAPETTFQLATKRDALMALVSNSITPLSGRDPEAFQFLASLVRRLPTYRLLIGTDRGRIPGAITRLLEQSEQDTGAELP